ncbi:MAG TPA: hypothetical protein VMW18_06460 [Candidatus Binatia bacterium]|nr:hypothetical protein [Candidatus Binatia bacterium]
MSLNDQILSERQKTWHGMGRLLFWGSVEALVLTLVTVLFAVNGPSVGLFILGFGLIIVVSAVVLARITART